LAFLVGIGEFDSLGIHPIKCPHFVMFYPITFGPIPHQFGGPMLPLFRLRRAIEDVLPGIGEARIDSDAFSNLQFK
jgi:hypothetical protein